MTIGLLGPCSSFVCLLGTQGTGVFTIQVEVILSAILEVLANVGFGFLLLSNRAALSEPNSASAYVVAGDEVRFVAHLGTK